MEATDDNVRAQPGHFQRTFHTCDWFLGDLKLFHERTYTPWGRPMSVEYWLPLDGPDEEHLFKQVKAAGLDPEQYVARGHPYTDGFFLWTADWDAAMAFTNKITLPKLEKAHDNG